MVCHYYWLIMWGLWGQQGGRPLYFFNSDLMKWKEPVEDFQRPPCYAHNSPLFIQAFETETCKPLTQTRPFPFTTPPQGERAEWGVFDLAVATALDSCTLKGFSKRQLKVSESLQLSHDRWARSIIFNKDCRSLETKETWHVIFWVPTWLYNTGRRWFLLYFVFPVLPKFKEHKRLIRLHFDFYLYQRVIHLSEIFFTAAPCANGIVLKKKARRELKNIYKLSKSIVRLSLQEAP